MCKNFLWINLLSAAPPPQFRHRLPINKVINFVRSRREGDLQERLLDNTYRLLEEIGRGGFGAVFRAVRIGAEGSGPVAIKFLNRGNLPSLQEQIRFQREATLMSQLLHPGTVTVYELGESEGRAYIVMEYVDGQNLRDYVRTRGGRLPLADILEILIQAAEALEYVHGHNICL
jgi:serine/threonine protein kinase